MKKSLGASFYLGVTKIMIRLCSVPETWCTMDGRMDGQMDGQMGGQIEGWTDGWTNGKSKI